MSRAQARQCTRMPNPNACPFAPGAALMYCRRVPFAIRVRSEGQTNGMAPVSDTATEISCGRLVAESEFRIRNLE